MRIPSSKSHVRVTHGRWKLLTTPFHSETPSIRVWRSHWSPQGNRRVLPAQAPPPRTRGARKATFRTIRMELCQFAAARWTHSWQAAEDLAPLLNSPLSFLSTYRVSVTGSVCTWPSALIRTRYVPLARASASQEIVWDPEFCGPAASVRTFRPSISKTSICKRAA